MDWTTSWRWSLTMAISSPWPEAICVWSCRVRNTTCGRKAGSVAFLVQFPRSTWLATMWHRVLDSMGWRAVIQQSSSCILCILIIHTRSWIHTANTLGGQMRLAWTSQLMSCNFCLHQTPLLSSNHRMWLAFLFYLIVEQWLHCHVGACF